MCAKGRYQQLNAPGSGETQLEMLRSLELGHDDFKAIEAECRRCGIGFLSSPFDRESVDFLSTIPMDYWKIPSGEITNLPFLRQIGAMGGRVIMSTGMSEYAEIEAAIRVLEKAGTPVKPLLCCIATPSIPRQWAM